jgi:hypothetical protein
MAENSQMRHKAVDQSMLSAQDMFSIGYKLCSVELTKPSIAPEPCCLTHCLPGGANNAAGISGG